MSSSCLCSLACPSLLRVEQLENELSALQHQLHAQLSLCKEEFRQQIIALEKRLEYKAQEANPSILKHINSLDDCASTAESSSETSYSNSGSFPNLAMYNHPSNANNSHDLNIPRIQPFNSSDLIKAQLHAAVSSHSVNSTVKPISSYSSLWSNDGFIDSECEEFPSSRNHSITKKSDSLVPSYPSLHSYLKLSSLSEDELIALTCKILIEHGSVPVGKLGSLLHKAANDHTLPALLKERYGGLKKFLQSQGKWFLLADNHVYNPDVTLNPAIHSELQAAIAYKSIDSHPFSSPALSNSYSNRCSQSKANSASTTNLNHINEHSLFSSPLINRTNPLNPFSSSLPIKSDHSQLFHENFFLTNDTTSNQENNNLNYLAMDCEMVGVANNRSLLARCSIVNQFGQVIYNKYILPTEAVLDYRTHINGIKAEHLLPNNAIPFKQCQIEVLHLIHGKILLGHSISSDLTALGITHPLNSLIDTSLCKYLCPAQPRSLKSLVVEKLSWHSFQSAAHDSIQDARAVLALYKSIEEQHSCIAANCTNHSS
jgi:hypothetical protein